MTPAPGGPAGQIVVIDSAFASLVTRVGPPEARVAIAPDRRFASLVTSIVSTLTGIAVRKDVAMTGEISLRGRVMPIGGLKEKLLAALRGGLKTVLIPKENERDLPEIPDNVKRGLEIIPVSTVDEVLAKALVKPLVAIEWPNDLEVVAAKPAEGPEAIRAH